MEQLKEEKMMAEKSKFEEELENEFEEDIAIKKIVEEYKWS